MFPFQAGPGTLIMATGPQDFNRTEFDRLNEIKGHLEIALLEKHFLRESREAPGKQPAGVGQRRDVALSRHAQSFSSGCGLGTDVARKSGGPHLPSGSCSCVSHLLLPRLEGDRRDEASP